MGNSWPSHALTWSALKGVISADRKVKHPSIVLLVQLKENKNRIAHPTQRSPPKKRPEDAPNEMTETPGEDQRRRQRQL